MLEVKPISASHSMCGRLGIHNLKHYLILLTHVTHKHTFDDLLLELLIVEQHDFGKKVWGAPYLSLDSNYIQASDTTWMADQCGVWNIRKEDQRLALNARLIPEQMDEAICALISIQQWWQDKLLVKS